MPDAAKPKKVYPRKTKQLCRTPLCTLAGVITEMGKVYRMARHGMLAHDNARSLVWMLDKLRSALEAQTLERLEAKMDALAEYANGMKVIDGHAITAKEHRLPN